MRPVYEPAEIVRPPVKPRRREPIHAVITPAEAARNIGHRHDLDNRHTKLCKLGQQLRGRFPSSFLCKRADVHLVEDLSAPARFDAAPVAIRPRKAGRIDYLRW